jgi:hypothetical protein
MNSVEYRWMRNPTNVITRTITSDRGSRKSPTDGWYSAAISIHTQRVSVYAFPEGGSVRKE